MYKFEKELALIKNEHIRKLAMAGVALIPDYFYIVPASSSGKYHPEYALGEGGLYRHVKAAVLIAHNLFTIHNFTPLEQDIIVASLILHDGWKQGLPDWSNGHTLFEHPLIASEVLMEGLKNFDQIILKCICECIESHMGQWNTSPHSKLVLPLPDTSMRRFVHMCDYLASRKAIEVKIDN